MSNKLIQMLEKKSRTAETLQRASEMIKNMDERNEMREKKVVRDRGDFYDSFRDDLKNNKIVSIIHPENQLPNQMLNHSPEHLSEHLSEQLSEHSIKLLSEQTTGQMSGQIDGQFNGHIDGQSSPLHQDFVPDLSDLDWSKKPRILTERQYATLFFIYHNRPFVVKAQLSKILTMGYSNARNCIDALVKKGFINKPFRDNSMPTMSSNCHVVMEKCQPLFGPTLIENPAINSEQLNGQISGQMDKHFSEQSNGHTPPLISSSSSLNKTTTNSIQEIEAQLNHPAMAKWRGWGLRAKQIFQWLESEPMATLTDLALSLRHMEFQLVDQAYFEKRKEEGNPIRDRISWFWATFKERGFFVPEPSGYISWEKKRTNETLAAAQKLEKERQELLEAQINLELQHILQDPNSEKFNAVFNAMDNFSKKRFMSPEKRCGELFVQSMRKGLLNLKNAENFAETAPAN